MDHFISPLVKKIIDTAIEEDCGRGDVTSRLTVPADATTTGRAIARRPLVMSGGDIFALVMARIDSDITVDLTVRDGQKAEAGELLATARGRVSSLLMAERVALNFLMHLSGVATLTSQFVARLPYGSLTRIIDTRKTTPGLRALERRAVRHGGGYNHRVDLSGGVLIKENHITAAGSVTEAVRRCIDGAPHPLRVEVEVQNETELKKALEAGARAILLDNMTVAELQRAVDIAKGRAFLEASGGVTLDTVGDIAKTGVDAISVGSLTHSAPTADISFLLDSV